jgi:hypothetical protein
LMGHQSILKECSLSSSFLHIAIGTGPPRQSPHTPLFAPNKSLLFYHLGHL